jgi:two-component system OmpR family sensor kinase
VIDVAWGIFAAFNLLEIMWMKHWETIPFHVIWISLILVYGFRSWPLGPTAWVLAVTMVTTAAGMAVDVWRAWEDPQELTEVPLMAAAFIAMVWHVRRKQAAEAAARGFGEENARLLDSQRQFLQDAAHQLRTPITIALGHAELLATGLNGHQEGQDIRVVIGELSRLRRISERLLLIAAADDPEFLRPELVALHEMCMDLIRRWRPTAERTWRIGLLDEVWVRADRERLGLALDALCENAVRHTATGDVIQLSVIKGWPGRPARIVVADSGTGIAADRLDFVFDRFRTGHDGGTGLGLPLVRAVARAHGGDVTVRSAPGKGSEFEIILPDPDPADAQAGPGTRALPEGAKTGSEHNEGRSPAHRPLQAGGGDRRGVHRGTRRDHRDRWQRLGRVQRLGYGQAPGRAGLHRVPPRQLREEDLAEPVRGQAGRPQLLGVVVRALPAGDAAARPVVQAAARPREPDRPGRERHHRQRAEVRPGKGGHLPHRVRPADPGGQRLQRQRTPADVLPERQAPDRPAPRWPPDHGRPRERAAANG